MTSHIMYDILTPWVLEKLGGGGGGLFFFLGGGGGRARIA